MLKESFRAPFAATSRVRPLLLEWNIFASYDSIRFVWLNRLCGRSLSETGVSWVGEQEGWIWMSFIYLTMLGGKVIITIVAKSQYSRVSSTNGTSLSEIEERGRMNWGLGVEYEWLSSSGLSILWYQFRIVISNWIWLETKNLLNLVWNWYG